jgi:hypothetical protein
MKPTDVKWCHRQRKEAFLWRNFTKDVMTYRLEQNKSRVYRRRDKLQKTLRKIWCLTDNASKESQG